MSSVSFTTNIIKTKPWLNRLLSTNKHLTPTPRRLSPPSACSSPDLEHMFRGGQTLLLDNFLNHCHSSANDSIKIISNHYSAAATLAEVRCCQRKWFMFLRPHLTVLQWCDSMVTYGQHSHGVVTMIIIEANFITYNEIRYRECRLTCLTLHNEHHQEVMDSSNHWIWNVE